MTQEEKDLLNKFSELKYKIKILTEEADELKTKATDILVKADKDEIETDLGKIIKQTRRKYNYPQEVLEVLADAQVAKKKAEADGSAEYEEKSTVSFYSS